VAKADAIIEEKRPMRKDAGTTDWAVGLGKAYLNYESRLRKQPEQDSPVFFVEAE
jgi:hypothetical protein